MIICNVLYVTCVCMCVYGKTACMDTYTCKSHKDDNFSAAEITIITVDNTIK